MQGTSDAVGLFPIRSEQRRSGRRICNSRLVPSGLSKCGVRFVARLVKGMAIDFDSLRAAIRIWQQRITPIS